ncbi:Crp/Fnr family transcriptional regulator [Calothrix membranacea FACHB-236]|nr:Crp/Fnr family transcriptional regulator [Calothrix membranacea FACHB-236]
MAHFRRTVLVSLQQRHGKTLNAALTVAVVRNQDGKVVSFHWLIRNITERPQWQSSEDNSINSILQNRQLSKYSKGENITLNPLEIFYVNQGWVKLSTFCDTGEEVLIGLAGPGMVFGSSMTSLNIYQAIALSNVELVSIYMTEIPTSSTLTSTILPKINQRLQQTESFLAISGRRQVPERLHYFLQFLKQEIGEPVFEGTRLKVRLTHEDIASACCANRVTITRLMSKLRKEGIICFDPKKHIIIKNFN